jgi:hypothetical protein
MKKLPSKKAIKKQLKRELAKDIVRDVKKKACKKARRGMLHLTGKLVLAGVILFVVTFTVYMLNLENKLIYNVIYPFLQRHYDAQSRDRRI